MILHLHGLLPTKMCHDIGDNRVPPPLLRLTRGTIRVSKVSAGGAIPRLLMSYCSQSFLSLATHAFLVCHLFLAVQTATFDF